MRPQDSRASTSLLLPVPLGMALPHTRSPLPRGAALQCGQRQHPALSRRMGAQWCRLPPASGHLRKLIALLRSRTLAGGLHPPLQVVSPKAVDVAQQQQLTTSLHFFTRQAVQENGCHSFWISWSRVACVGRGRGGFSGGPGPAARGMPPNAQANRAAAAAQVGQSAREISRMADAAREKRDEAKARERERERPRESRITATATAERPRGRDRERDRQATCCAHRLVWPVMCLEKWSLIPVSS